MDKRFFKNTSWIIGGQILKSILAFVISILTARYLGPSNYGVIGYITSIIVMFTAVANLGLGNIIVKEFIIRKENSGEIIGTAITMQIISSTICYFAIFGIVVALNINDRVMWFCALLQSGTLVCAAFDNINYYYQSRLESKYTTIISLVAYIIVQGYKVYLLVAKKSVLWFAFANTLDALLVAIFLIAAYFCQKGAKWKFSFATAKRLIRLSAPFILSGSVSVIYASLDRIMLKEFLGGTESVGFYNTAYTISHSWVFVIGAIITSFSPLIFESHLKDPKGSEYRIRLRQLYFLIFWLCTAASVALNIVSPFLIELLYGEAYVPSVVPTMILTWSIAFAYLGIAQGIYFVCENLQKYIVIFAAMTVVLNAAMNALLIPVLGVTGATVATVVSEIFVCIIAPMLFKKTRVVSIDILKAIAFQGIQFQSMLDFIKTKIFKRKSSDVDNGDNTGGEDDLGKEEGNAENSEKTTDDVGVDHLDAEPSGADGTEPSEEK